MPVNSSDSEVIQPTSQPTFKPEGSGNAHTPFRFFRYLFSNVRNRLIVSFAVILIIPSLAIGGFAYLTAKKTVQDRMQMNASENIGLLNSNISLFFQPQFDNIQFVAKQVDVSMLQGPNPTLGGRLLIPFLNSHPELANVYFAGTNGIFLNAKRVAVPEGYDPKQQNWYKEAMASRGKVAVTPAYRSKATGDFVVSLSKATDDGTGIVQFEVKLDTLAKIAEGTKVGIQGYPYILDRNATVLMHPVLEVGTAVEGSPFTEMMQSDGGTVGYEWEGKMKMLSFITNPLTNWKIAGTWYTDEAVQEAAPIFYRTFMVLVVALAAGALLVWFIIRSIVKPLKHLSQVSERVGAGDLTERVRITSRDEIGQLGQRFNEMADSLRHVLAEVSQTSGLLAAASQELSESAEQSTLSTEHVASSMQEMAEGADRQVRSVEESGETVSAMAQNVGQIASTTQAVSTAATEASQQSAEGSRAIDTAIGQMSSIRSSVDDLAGQVEGLSVHSQEIGNIVQVITDIADQTNLLALNAAIEAARAGEDGRGFAIVAGEVRKLAEQSAASAKQIDKLVTSLQQGTEQAVASMEHARQEVQTGTDIIDSAGRMFGQIRQSVNEVAQQIEGVSITSQRISAGTSQVVQSVESILEIATTTVSGTQNVSAAAEQQLASMEEITSSAASLSHTAEQLKQLVAKFKI